MTQRSVPWTERFAQYSAAFSLRIETMAQESLMEQHSPTGVGKLIRLKHLKAVEWCIFWIYSHNCVKGAVFKRYLNTVLSPIIVVYAATEPETFIEYKGPGCWTETITIIHINFTANHSDFLFPDRKKDKLLYNINRWLIVFWRWLWYDLLNSARNKNPCWLRVD